MILAGKVVEVMLANIEPEEPPGYYSTSAILNFSADMKYLKSSLEILEDSVNFSRLLFLI